MRKEKTSKHAFSDNWLEALRHKLTIKVISLVSIFVGFRPLLGLCAAMGVFFSD